MDTDTMKAVRVARFGGPETVKIERIPKPKPGTGEVLVRVEACAINPIDWKLREGIFKDLKLPFTPGGDFCGSIEELGAGVTEYEKGQAVYGCAPGSVGADAEYVVCPTANLASKPRVLGPIEAASVPLAAMTAWQGLYAHGGLESGQTVLILGASGGVGSFAVQLAKLKGARVIGTASAANVDRVRGLGADVVVDYKKEKIEDVAKDVDLVFDLVGGELQKRAFACVKPGGRLISTVQPPDDRLAKKNKITAMMFRMKPDAGQLRELATRIDAQDIEVEVAKIMPLDKAAEAEELNRGQKVDGKIVLQVGR